MILSMATVIVFSDVKRSKLHKGRQTLPQDRECDETCKERMKNESKAMILDEAKTITDILKQVSVKHSSIVI